MIVTVWSAAIRKVQFLDSDAGLARKARRIVVANECDQPPRMWAEPILPQHILKVRHGVLPGQDPSQFEEQGEVKWRAESCIDALMRDTAANQETIEGSGLKTSGIARRAVRTVAGDQTSLATIRDRGLPTITQMCAWRQGESAADRIAVCLTHFG